MTPAFVENFVFKWYIEVIALILFRVARPMIALDDERTFNTKKFVIFVVVWDPTATMTRNVMVVTICIVFPQKILHYVGVGCNFSSSMPISKNTYQNRTSIELPLSVKILQVVQFAMSRLTTKALSCGYNTLFPSLFLKDMEVVFLVLVYFECLPTAKTSSYLALLA